CIASSASSRLRVMFMVNRKILRSYRLTSSSKAAASPDFAAATSAGSSSRTNFDENRCGLGALNAATFDAPKTILGNSTHLLITVAQCTGVPVRQLFGCDSGSRDSGNTRIL